MALADEFNRLFYDLMFIRRQETTRSILVYEVFLFPFSVVLGIPNRQDALGFQVVEDRKDRRLHRSRKIRVLEDVPDRERERKNLVAVPVVGAVAAGKPILAEENIIGELLVDADLVRVGRFFALEVAGDSMIGAGIRHGDTVLVRQQPLAETGDIVVAVLGGEATVKRLHLRDGAIALRPENPAYQSIMIDPENDLRIAGKVVGVQHSDTVSE